MLRRIIAKEMLEHLMSLRFAIACGLCFLVILGSLFVRGQEHRLALSDYHEDAAAAKRTLDDYRGPWDVVWDGMRIHRPPNPLKVFVRGLDDSARLSAHVNAWRPVELITSEEGNPLTPLFPAMDVVTFVGIVMSLLALVFGYDAVCGERERGTLSLMLSYSVPRDRVILGKWIGGYVMLVLPFVIALAGGAALVLLQPDVSLSAGEWARLAAVGALALLYMAAMYGLAVWVSCLTRRSATSVMILVTIWLVLVLAIPNLSPYLARGIRPTRNPLEVDVAQETAATRIWQRVVEEPLKVYDREHGFPDPWWTIASDSSAWTPEQEKIARRQIEESRLEKAANMERLETYAKLGHSFEIELDRQVSLGCWISRLSPFSCFAMSAVALTDTGVAEQRRLLAQLAKYQRDLAEVAHGECIRLNQYYLDHQGKGLAWKGKDRNPIPVFAYVPGAAAGYFSDIVLDAGILLAAGIVFLMLSYAAFLRYDVR